MYRRSAGSRGPPARARATRRRVIRAPYCSLRGVEGPLRRPAARPLVDDVDAVVLAVGAGDPEHDAQPAPEAEPALARELASETRARPSPLVVLPSLLGHAVDEHLERTVERRAAGRPASAEPPFVECQRPCADSPRSPPSCSAHSRSPCPPSPANAGLDPGRRRSRRTREAINDTYWLLVGITGFVFVLVQGALLVVPDPLPAPARPVDAEGPQIHGNTGSRSCGRSSRCCSSRSIVGFVFYKLPEISSSRTSASAAADDASSASTSTAASSTGVPLPRTASVAFDTLRCPSTASSSST